MADLRIVLYREQDLWVAQGLELDIRAQGTTVEEVEIRLDAVLLEEERYTTERHGKAFHGIGQAPKKFFDMWDNAPGSYSPKEDGHKHEMALCA